MRFGAVLCLYDDHEYLDICLFPISKYLEKVLFLMSDVPWNGSKSDNSETMRRVKEICSRDPNRFSLQVGHWTNEMDQRNHGLQVQLNQGIDYSFVIDSDEIYAERDFQNILRYIESNPKFDAFHLEWNTYWTKKYYIINPREHYKPLIAVRPSHFHFTIIRGGTTAVVRAGDTILKTQGEYNAVLIPPQVAICHHLSYARDDTYMKRKLETNSHNPEFIPDWYEKVWKTWAPGKENLHPVTPEQYRTAVKSDFSIFPDQLKIFYKREHLENRPCSIIILNWNSCDFLKRCLECIKENTERPYEVILIDNGSTEDASVEFFQETGYKKVINDKNLGFAGGVNTGLRLVSPGNDICLLNADAEVQKGWLTQMYKTMMKIPDVGIVGPLGNEVENGYQSEGMINEDATVPNVFGFCLLIMRELYDKIGIFDERFYPGGAEDMDYCMRARLSNYRVALSAKSLVRHKAHQIYQLNSIENKQRLERDDHNNRLYYEKYFGMLSEYGRVYNYFIPELMYRTGLIIKG